MIDQDTAARISFELHGAARLWRRNFDRRAREHELSRSRWQVLWHLARTEGLKQAELAERMDIAPISLGRQLEEFIHEEARLSPPRLELEDFYKDVQALGLRVDRLESRTRRLRKRLQQLRA